jgi:hypothetical protein
MNVSFRISPAVFLMLIFCAVASAQMARKPTPTREPAGSMPSVPDSNKNALTKIASQEDFDSSRPEPIIKGTPYSLPHTMFVIDRRAKNKVYFINSQRFRFHKDFLLATYLVPRGADVFKPIYIDTDRRFIVGTIAWQRTVDKFTWELWEGDLATPEIIKSANDAINSTFFTTVAYKPNSIRQEDASAELGIERVLQSDINKNQEYLALNPGKAVGRIHIIDKLDDTVEIGDNEIIVLKELPITLPPVRGIIVAKPSSPLSHINILAKGWNVPNVYIKDADKLFRDKDTFVWEFDATMSNYKFTPVDVEKLKTDFRSPDQQVPPSNLAVTRLAGLREQRKSDSIIYGAKSANLGEMLHAKIPELLCLTVLPCRLRGINGS